MNLTPNPANFPISSTESRAAARGMLSLRPVWVINLGALPVTREFLPTYKQLLSEWQDGGDRYTHEATTDDILHRWAILKDSDDFRRIKAGSSKCNRGVLLSDRFESQSAARSMPERPEPAS